MIFLPFLAKRSKCRPSASFDGNPELVLERIYLKRHTLLFAFVPTSYFVNLRIDGFTCTTLAEERTREMLEGEWELKTM
jgi:hypothetical protein